MDYIKKPQEGGTIAVIDDDEYIGNMLEELLEKEGYRVLRAYSGTEALLLLAGERPDLVLLDLMLPGMRGEDVLPKLQGIPVIVVSARAEVENKVELLLGGAADYVTKPFDTRELLARIRVALRRAAAGDGGSLLRAAGLAMDTRQHTVRAGEAEVRLTRTEFSLLKLLLENRGRVLTKAQILDAISLESPDCVESSLKVHVSNLRRKLREASDRDYIEAVWGIGFKLREE